METNELPEEVKKKIDEAVAKIYWATQIRFPLRTVYQVHEEQAEVIAEIYRLALQSKEEEMAQLKKALLESAPDIEADKRLFDSVNSMREQLKAKEEEYGRLRLAAIDVVSCQSPQFLDEYIKKLEEVLLSQSTDKP